MFFLEDGRPTLFQWDLNRRVRISDPAVTEVHFCNGSADCALVVKTYTDDTYDGQLYAEIPNILLQSDLPIKAYAYVNDTYTKECQTFRVVKRNQPSDYIYEETDILYASQVLDKADDVLDEARDVLANSQSILDNAQSYVDRAEAAVGEAEAAVSEAEAAVVDAENTIKGFDEYVEGHKLTLTNDGEGNVTISGVNLSDLDYYTKDEVDNLIPDDYITDIPDHYVTEEELEAKGYLTNHQSLEAYATKDYVTTATNDLATEEYVHQMFDGANKALSYSNYADMVTALNSAPNNKYAVGQNIMIVTLSVPDLWVSQVANNRVTYSYTSDNDLTLALVQKGVVQVGYYVLSALETQKVDLTNYSTDDEVTEAISNAITGAAQVITDSTSTAINLSVNSLAPVLNYVYSAGITSIAQLATNRVQGHSIQFKTGSSCTVTDTSTYIGDDCADGVFTPQANTNYDIYSYYNNTKNTTVNMVMSLGA